MINESAAPTVTNLQRYGFHAQPTVVVLTFSGALDPTPAENIANYTVTGATDGFTITSAVYNPANDTVTLRFSQRLNVHLTYTITVSGMAPNGLTGANGPLLDGADNGQPGSNYVKTFGMGCLAGPASAAGSSSTALTLAQIDHGHITSKAIDELVAEWELEVRHHRARH